MAHPHTRRELVVRACDDADPCLYLNLGRNCHRATVALEIMERDRTGDTRGYDTRMGAFKRRSTTRYTA